MSQPKNEKMRTCRIVNFAIPADHRVKMKEREKKDKYFYLARELKKPMEHESDDDTNCKLSAGYSHSRINKGIERLGKKKIRLDHPTTAFLRAARIL